MSILSDVMQAGALLEIYIYAFCSLLFNYLTALYTDHICLAYAAGLMKK